MASKSTGLNVVTANVNGIRATARRGGLEWLAQSGADVICLQEVASYDRPIRGKHSREVNSKTGTCITHPRLNWDVRGVAGSQSVGTT